MVDKTWTKWHKRIEHEKREHAQFRKAAEKALKVYENEENKLSKKREVVFPILRNVVEVQLGLIAAKQPQAKISKRFNEDQTELCMKLEKAANYFVETGSMQREATEAFEDYLTAGLGGLRVVYDYEEEDIVNDFIEVDPVTGNEVVIEYAAEVVGTRIVNESLIAERYEWINFGWEPCKRWSECDYIYFKSSLTPADFRRQFKVHPNKYVQDDDNQKADIQVYEVWDKRTKNVYWLSDSHSEILDSAKNPLGTDYFYPCAEPMLFALLHDDYEPRPEFSFWESLHDNVQELSRRESALIKAIKDIEFYDRNTFDSVAALENAKDGTKFPVDVTRFLSEGGRFDFNSVISSKDHTTRVAVLDKITSKRDELLDKIYQTTGIADIMQGISDPRETARAQGYKNAWGNARLSQKRYMFENHIRDTIEVMVNTMVKLFQPESIAQAAGLPLTEQEVMYLQQSDEYRTDVETLSTLSMDKDRDQQNAVELTTAVTGLFAQGSQVPAPLIHSLLQNMVRTFPDGRELESSLETLPQYIDTVQQLQQQLQQLEQQSAEMQQQNMALAAELNKYNEAKRQKDQADAQKKMADVQSTLADVAKKEAETEQTIVETIQQADSQMVMPDAMIDEQQAWASRI